MHFYILQKLWLFTLLYDAQNNIWDTPNDAINNFQYDCQRGWFYLPIEKWYQRIAYNLPYIYIII